MKVTQRKAKNMIKATGGRIFTATFTKKDGSVRDMNCRLGVKKHLKGGKLNYAPSEYGLISVFEVQKDGFQPVGYKMINIKTLKSLAIDGKIYKVVK